MRRRASGGRGFGWYQVVSDAPVDLGYAPGWVSHVELASEPDLAAGFERIASFALNGVGARPSAR